MLQNKWPDSGSPLSHKKCVEVSSRWRGSRSSAEAVICQNRSKLASLRRDFKVEMLMAVKA